MVAIVVDPKWNGLVKVTMRSGDDVHKTKSYQPIHLDLVQGFEGSGDPKHKFGGGMW